MIDPQQFPFDAKRHPEARPAQRITFVAQDCDENTAFAALQGANRHGNEFIAQALEKGAPFVLTDQDVQRGLQVADATAALRQWARHQRDLHDQAVIGITGSAGKTTAKEYVRAAVDGVATPGNLNTLNAIACFLLEHAGQTPAPLVLEMGIDRIGEMQELVELTSPDYGVVTAVGEAHLEFLGTVENVAREKGGILQARKLGVVSQRCTAFYPGVPTYGMEHGTFQGRNLTFEPTQCHFQFLGDAITVPTTSQVVAEAAVLGLGLARELGLNLREAAERIRSVDVPGGRFRVHPGIVTVIDDTYNANPISMRASLENLKHYSGRKVAVLGDMLELGQNAAEYHRGIGLHAQQNADLVFSVGQFAEQLSAHPHSDMAALIQTLKNEVRAGDVVLFKASRGIRLEQAVQAVREVFGV
ncbi:UDP-N-acetylmuramoyl-tripeptide--D-alanyl-D-alanine ligase [Deinococcus roseus]|uniref:UDP-N-acetylmuramoyl-tripeptide--D-alanyl-D-alanine ligase n=1 Tax=Deinococcus roseus TaxID=392414 RepID=A0ABQ2CW68_9DEIO|nr:UDP-N-acetylmuramoyl-tripeptide--D-alanyl-D-alanine ligase [Deinococcus roseus]GGJ19937.1 UDP-N-acetylmuramoyl-tripeptide--D-alanyl-D-alanine ligase [Deinococcus roseus]